MPVPPPRHGERAGCNVEYLTSTLMMGATAHFYHAFDAERVIIIADHHLGKLDFDAAAQRCVAMSKLQQVIAPGPVMADIVCSERRTKYDELMRQYAPEDVVRLLGALYRPAEREVPVLELEDPLRITPVASCKKGALTRREPTRAAQAVDRPPHAQPFAAAPAAASRGMYTAAGRVDPERQGGHRGWVQVGAQRPPMLPVQ